MITRFRGLTLPAVALLAAAGVFATSQVAAAPSCALDDAFVTDATGLTKDADACFGVVDQIGSANPTRETNDVNDEWGGDPAGDFSYIGKWEVGQNQEAPAGSFDDSDVSSAFAGFTLTLFEGDDDYTFGFTLEAPDNYAGAIIDFVLGIKQSTEFVAYRFDNVTLDLDGGFNSIFTNPQGRPTDDFSHVSGFVRIVDHSTVPEPGSLGLMGFALLMMGLVMRRRLR